MKRNPRKVSWTKIHRSAHGKEMVVVCIVWDHAILPNHVVDCRILQDSTLEFEKRRNVPIRYDRDLVNFTIKAANRVAEIRNKRERVAQMSRKLQGRERSIPSKNRIEDMDIVAEIETKSEIEKIEAVNQLSDDKTKLMEIA